MPNETTARLVMEGVFARIGPDEWTADDCRDFTTDMLASLAEHGLRVVKTCSMTSNKSEATVPMMASEQITALIDAMDSVLDDMGPVMQSVCLHTKAKARIAFEPFLDPECVQFVMSLDEAKRIVKECDDAN